MQAAFTRALSWTRLPGGRTFSGGASQWVTGAGPCGTTPQWRRSVAAASGPPPGACDADPPGKSLLTVTRTRPVDACCSTTTLTEAVRRCGRCARKETS